MRFQGCVFLLVAVGVRLPWAMQILQPPAERAATAVAQLAGALPGVAAPPEPSERFSFQDELSELGIELLPNPCPTCRSPVARKKPIVWIHVHKSAGTTMCGLAKRNGERVATPNYNCDWWPHDTISAGNHMNISCANRAAQWKAQGATFGMVEHVIETPYLCPQQFNYVIMLRDPNQLAVSKANYGLYDAITTRKSMECVTKRQCGRTFTGDQGQGGHMLWWFFDNFLTRTFGGHIVFGLPPGNITDEHALKAIKTISTFNVIMFVDELKQSKPSVVETALHWETVTTGSSQGEGIKASNVASHKVSLSQAELQVAKALNRHDYTIYDHFHRIPQKGRFGALV